jgi:hypothetical protein
MRTIFNRPLSGILILLVLIGLLSPLARAEGLIVSLDGLLPSKNDDPIAYPVLREPEWYFGSSWSENLSALGFVEGRAVGYYKRFFAHSDMSVEFYVYLFSNVSSAEAYCNTEVDQIKSEGGCAEVSISSTFAVVYDYGTQEIGVSWGVISNVVFKVAVYTANIVEDPTDQLVRFTVLERTRILALSESTGAPPSTPPDSPAGTIPEFPSFIVFPLFIVATLLVAIIISRRNNLHNTRCSTPKKESKNR